VRNCQHSECIHNKCFDNNLQYPLYCSADVVITNSLRFIILVERVQCTEIYFWGTGEKVTSNSCYFKILMFMCVHVKKTYVSFNFLKG